MLIGKGEKKDRPDPQVHKPPLNLASTKLGQLTQLIIYTRDLKENTSGGIAEVSLIPLQQLLVNS